MMDVCISLAIKPANWVLKYWDLPRLSCSIVDLLHWSNCTLYTLVEQSILHECATLFEAGVHNYLSQHHETAPRRYCQTVSPGLCNATSQLSYPTPPIFISIELAAPAQILQCTAAPLFYSFLDLICSLARPRDGEPNALQPRCSCQYYRCEGGTTWLHNCAFSNLITAREACRALLSTQEPVLEAWEENGLLQIMEHQPALSDAVMRQPVPHFYSTDTSRFSSRDPTGPLGFPVGMSLTCD